MIPRKKLRIQLWRILLADTNMSSYFYHRTRNLPTTTTNTTSVAASSRTEVAPVLSDQELLESALEFEKTATFQQAEQEAKKARGQWESRSTRLLYAFSSRH